MSLRNCCAGYIQLKLLFRSPSLSLLSSQPFVHFRSSKKQKTRFCCYLHGLRSLLPSSFVPSRFRASRLDGLPTCAFSSPNVTCRPFKIEGRLCCYLQHILRDECASVVNSNRICVRAFTISPGSWFSFFLLSTVGLLPGFTSY